MSPGAPNTYALNKVQQINLPNTFSGLVWAPVQHAVLRLGRHRRRVYVYKRDRSQFVPDAPFILLGHNSDQTQPFPKYDAGCEVRHAEALPPAVTGAVVAGLDIMPAKTLVAASLDARPRRASTADAPKC